MIETVKAIERRVFVTFIGDPAERAWFNYTVLNIDAKAGTQADECDLAFLDTDQHTYTVVIGAADDGTYTIEANGAAATFVASSKSIEEIRDGIYDAAVIAWPAIADVAKVSTNTITVSALATPIAYVLAATSNPSSNISWTEPVGEFGGSNTIFSTVTNSVTATPTELVVSEGPSEPRPFNLKGSEGIFQVVILLPAGADGTTDYDMTLQAYIEPAYLH